MEHAELIAELRTWRIERSVISESEEHVYGQAHRSDVWHASDDDAVSLLERATAALVELTGATLADPTLEDVPDWLVELLAGDGVRVTGFDAQSPEFGNVEPTWSVSVKAGRNDALAEVPEPGDWTVPHLVNREWLEAHASVRYSYEVGFEVLR